MADQPDKPADAIPHVAEQQDSERIAYEERKRHAARTMEQLTERYGVPEKE